MNISRAPLVRTMFWIILVFLASASGVSQAQPKKELQSNRPILQLLCGDAGQACCLDLGRGGTVVGPSNCHAGLGCDTQANRCVTACGGAGQPCCDGPDTAAPRGGVSPSGPFAPKKRMCLTGACSRETHRCTTCGQLDGHACCPPDAQLAVPSCPAQGLYCKTWEGDPMKGICARCGHEGETPCPVDRCGSDLIAVDGVCVPCGRIGLRICEAQACSVGAPDPWEQRPLQTCVACGELGQPPCAFVGCKEGQVFKAGRVEICASSARCGKFAVDAVSVSRAIQKACFVRAVTFRFDTSGGSNDRWCQQATDEMLQADTATRQNYSAGCRVCNSYAGAITFENVTRMSCQYEVPAPKLDTDWTHHFDACIRAGPAGFASYSSFRSTYKCAPHGSGSGSGGSTRCCVRCVPDPSSPVPGVPGAGVPPGPPGCRPVYTCQGCP
jgi:hypothetical protein